MSATETYSFDNLQILSLSGTVLLLALLKERGATFTM